MPTKTTHIARISDEARDWFLAEITRRKLARQKPDNTLGLIDELVKAEQARRKVRVAHDAELDKRGLL
jgi:hypothetical protein